MVARELTAILYLCDARAWPSRYHTSDDADGALVLYLGAAPSDETGATAATIVKIQPVGGRLVLFDARSTLHAVQPHTRDTDRLALTCWLGGAFGWFGFLRPPGPSRPWT